MRRSKLAVAALEDRITPVAVPPGFALSELVGNLSQPTALQELPDGRFLIAQQQGALRLASADGQTLSTALTLTHPLTIVPAVALFVIGTLVRTHAEERLLRSAFGGAYDDYARKVPTLIPWRLPR